MKKIYGILMFLMLAVMSCEDEPVLDTEANLHQAWTHAREEQNDPNDLEMIFRLSDSQTFSPSHFRDAYEFYEDGNCRYMFLHPADAHSFKDGTYSYNATDRTLTILTADGDLWKRFEVKSFNADKLVMEFLP